MLVTVIFNLFLGSVIFIHGNKKKSDISYGVIILMLVFWSLSVLGIRLSSTFESALFYLASSHVFGLGISISFWYFVETFIGNNVSNKKLTLFIFPALLIGLLAFVSPKFIIDIQNLNSLNKNLILGYQHILFVLYFSLLMIYAFYKLYIEYKRSINNISSKAIVAVFLGTFISTSIGATFNIYYLLVGVSSYIAWGPISMIIMVVFIAYAIIRHNLMSIRVIGSEVFVISLFLTLTIRLMLSDSLTEWVINSVSLVISMSVGVFLIKSVYKEVHQREQIQKLADDLQKANQGQLNLIHFMNHQVKGRFGNAKNIFAELLTDDYGEMPKEARVLLEKGLEETNMGVDYVQSILRGASAEMGTLPYEMKQIDFRKIVVEVFEKQKSYAENKGLEIKLDIKEGDYNITGDDRQLSEAVKNLIDNSINYTKQGNINIGLSSSDFLRLVVKDTGVGISDEDKPKLFKSGGRGAESLKINVNSTGYGLAFVKGVVDAHKGRVWAESEGCDKGSSFYIELPKN